MISAKVIADSVAPSGVRLTTLELVYPRFIHSEFMTHRLFSRNASSSRAIPIEKILEQVRNDPAMPIHWGQNQSGMQARKELDSNSRKGAKDSWSRAARAAVVAATNMRSWNAHKQIVNRLLEPFQHITVVVTATEWDNFFELRDHEDAQPEIRELARAMRQAMESSNPQLLQPGVWHTPYSLLGTEGVDRIRTSVAGCARVSYNTHDSSARTIEKDLGLYEQLYVARHMSPFEHQATPMDDLHPIEGHPFWTEGITHLTSENEYWSGNFRGWIQYRQTI